MATRATHVSHPSNYTRGRCHATPGAMVHGQPGPQLAGLALVHGYTTAFWWTAAIFAAGAVICGTLLRRGPGE